MAAAQRLTPFTTLLSSPAAPVVQATLSVDVLPAAAPTNMAMSPSMNSTSVLRRMRSVLKRRQCVSQQEALSQCFMQQETEGGAGNQGLPCNQYMQQLRFCEQAMHSYTAVNTSFL